MVVGLALFREGGRRRAAGFLENHSLQFERMDHETNSNVRDDEYWQFSKASGWKDSVLETNKP